MHPRRPITSDAQIELHADIDFPTHFDQFGELNRLFGRILQIFDGENFQARVVDLHWSVMHRIES